MTANQIGTRELRSDLATHVRRAAAGHRVVISIGGRAAAVLGPIEDTGPDVGADALIAAGLLIPPRRPGAYRDVPPIPVWSGVRLDKALREVRG